MVLKTGKYALNDRSEWSVRAHEKQQLRSFFTLISNTAPCWACKDLRAIDHEFPGRWCKFARRFPISPFLLIPPPGGGAQARKAPSPYPVPTLKWNNST